MNAVVNDNKRLPLTQKELDHLKSLLQAGDRPGFYMAYYNMTGCEQAVMQAQISSFSEGSGGAAFVGNVLLQSYFGPQDQYLGIYRLSQLVAESAYNAIEASVQSGGTGVLTDSQMFLTASAAWNAAGQGNQFPGNIFEWPVTAFALGVPPGDTDSLLQNILDVCEGIADVNVLVDELISSGTLVALVATAFGPALLGKRLTDYAGDSAYRIVETPDGEWSSAIRVSDGKTVAVFDDDLLPDSIVDFANALGQLASSVITQGLSQFIGPIDSALQVIRMNLNEGAAGFNGDVNPNEVNPPFTPTDTHYSEQPTSANDILWGTDGLGGLLFADDTIDGGGGNDVIFGGDGDDVLTGGQGNDIIYGQADDDEINGEDGDDVLRGGEGEDYLRGGAGDDVLDLGDSEFNALIMQLPLVRDIALGNDGNDVIRGGGGYQELCGNNGNDVLYGGDGFDILSGDGGDDILVGGAGGAAGGEYSLRGNYLFGGEGNDSYYARNGQSDQINDGQHVQQGGYDHYYIDSFDSVVDINGSGVVHYRGNAILLDSIPDPYNNVPWTGTPTGWVSDDGALLFERQHNQQNVIYVLPLLVIDFPVVVLGFLSSVATITPESTPDLVEGEQRDGATSLYVAGSGVAEVLVGSEGADILEGLAGNDSLSGAADNDILLGGSGDDLLDGGDGVDLLDGGEGMDVLLGGNGNDRLIGGDGADDLSGGAGQDLLRGGALVGSSDAGDTYRFGLNGGADTIDESDTSVINADVIVFGEGINASMIVDTSNGYDRTFAIFGTDDSISVRDWHLDGSHQIERVEFFDGTVWDAEFLSQNPVLGTAGSDVLIGTLGRDLMQGFDGNDQVYGDEGDDILEGGAGDDLLQGNSGSDVLRGGAGNDWLTGGEDFDGAGNAPAVAGSDTFDFGLGGGHDTIADPDTSSSLDILRFTGVLTPEDINVYQRNNNLVFQITASGESISIINGQVDSNYQIERIEFGSGVTWDATQISFAIVGDDTSNFEMGTALDDVATTLGGSDYIQTGAGNDYLDGGTDDDSMIGGAGNDIYIVDSAGDSLTELASEGVDEVRSSVSWVLATNFENLTLLGEDDIGGTGNSVANALVGNGGANLLDGKAGADTLIGGGGNDTYVVDNTADVVVETEGEGIDLVRSSVSFALGGNVENITLTGSAAINASGNSLDNILTGNTAANALDGGLGNDTYVVGAGDTVVEAANEGTDTVQSAVSYTLGDNVENLLLTGSSAINGTGNSLGNLLTGNSGANVLTGGMGNDTYVVGSGDSVVEQDGEGIDTVQAAITTSLGNFIENLVLTGTGNINGTGNALANTITGNAGNNTINGGAGADVMSGGAGNDIYIVDDVADTIVEAADEGVDTVQASSTHSLSNNIENLTLTGSAAIDGTGNAGDNTLTGNSGLNILAGGAGNDTYIVQNTGDLIAENAAEGDDLVQSSVSYSMSNHVERLTLTGSGTINGTGNDLDNIITGNSGANVLNGGQGNDTLNGGAGADTLQGGAGDDRYIFEDASDTIVENTGEGVDTVESAVTYTLANNVENLILTGSSTINGMGNGSANVLTGNGAANTLNGGAGIDTMIGGGGNDTYVLDVVEDIIIELAGGGTDTVQSGITYTLGDHLENLTLTGSVAVNGTGNALNNTLRGNTGNNELTGGLGDDIYVVNNAGDSVVELAGEGTDTVQSSVTYTLSASVERLTLTGSSAINGTGNDLDNYITGNTGANALTGGAGNDTLDATGAGNDILIGGTGDDRYIVFGSVVITEVAGEGTDTVEAWATHTLANNVENIILMGSSQMNATGNALNNTLIGNEAANTLNGGGGADTMSGGAGNDTYVVDDAGDVVIEFEGNGTDLVQSAVSHALGVHVENLTLTGSAAINATGNDLNNVLTGNSGMNTLAGGLGNDTYVIGSGDTVVENAGEGIDTVQSALTHTLAAEVENLTLTGAVAIDGIGNELANVLIGNTAANTLSGGTGNDTLNGGAAADTLIGGLGNDTYVVDNVGDVVTESADEGVDLVQAGVTFTLSANVENLTLTGSTAINATGNDLDNVLIGNTGVNTLTGGQGNDTLNGGTGADVMVGGLGDDTYTVDNAGDTVTENVAEGTDHVFSSLAYTLGATVENLTLTGSSAINGTGNALDNILAGNTGTNTLTGGLGNDTYIVNNTADVAAENAAEGTDAVFSSVTYTLGANVENLTLTGTGAINATGNELDNMLAGNAGSNTLNGGIGADTMSGDAGNDVYVVDAAGDVVIEGEGAGTDTVQSAVTFTLAANVENLTLTGSAVVDGTGNSLDNVLTGNSGINTLTGGAGNDTLNGGSGNDTMVGGSGDDTYVVAQSGDVVTELYGEGTDLVQSSATHTLSNFVENLTLTGAFNVNAIGNALNNLLFGNTGNNTLTGHDGNDSLDGGSGTDTMVGGDGDDTYYSDVSGEVITEVANQGLDQVISSATQTLAENVEMLFLTGASQVDGNGNTSSNLLRGNDVRNIFSGGGGIDILEGAAGNDSLSNTGGGLFNGGIGNDSMSGGAGHDLYIGGAGNDSLTTGTGRDIISFNLGDGADTVSSSTTQDNTLSIGGGATYADLLFERTGNNLILRIGATDQITLTNYYGSASNLSLDTLQIIIEDTSDYDANSSNAMNNKKVESFDFDALVADFDAARAANPMLTSWSLTSSLLARHLGGSDTEALGGDLAYQYGRFGSLADISYIPALGVLATGTFGQSAQALQSSGALQDSSPRLS